MACTPSTLEIHASEAEAEALDYLHKAESLFGIAEDALLNEEKKHAPLVSVGNQRKLTRYAELMTVLARIREGTFSIGG